MDRRCWAVSSPPMAGMSWESFDLSGMNAAWVRPNRGHDRRRVILYCHGGTISSNLAIPARTWTRPCDSTRSCTFEYRLAPEPLPAVEERAEGLRII